jgi:FKBP-type peptidyl-prolyl cis-trans isomerase FklB
MKLFKKFCSIYLLLFTFSFSYIAKAQNTAEDLPYDNNNDKASYCFGLIVADGIKQQGFTDFNVELFTEAINAVLNENGQAKATIIDANEFLQRYFELNQQSQMQENMEKGLAFLEENKKQEGVVVLPSGLQYKVLVNGTGTGSPLATSTVTTHYRGTLIDGTEFDSSYKRGTPASFPVNGVIKGWTEALQLMKPGDKWQLFIPYQLAYGERGYPGAIPPKAVLIFEIELISFK